MDVVQRNYCNTMNQNDLRNIIIDKARIKYIDSGITKNITEALKNYLENDATGEEQIPLLISKPEIYRLKERLKINRPRCEECNSELQMEENVRDFAGKGYATAWICKCGRIEYSENTVKEWLEILNENR